MDGVWLDGQRLTCWETTVKLHIPPHPKGGGGDTNVFITALSSANVTILFPLLRCLQHDLHIAHTDEAPITLSISNKAACSINSLLLLCHLFYHFLMALYHVSITTLYAINNHYRCFVSILPIWSIIIPCIIHGPCLWHCHTVAYRTSVCQSMKIITHTLVYAEISYVYVRHRLYTFRARWHMLAYAGIRWHALRQK